MNKPYQWVIWLLIAALLLGACTSQPAATSTQPATAPTQATAKKITTAFFVPTMEDPWYAAAVLGAQKKADALGMTLNVYDAAMKVETQLTQFDTAVANKVDAIILSSVDPAAMVPSIEQAKAKGVKVVVYDRPIFETNQIDAMLVLDTSSMGLMVGQSILDYLTQKYGEPKGTIIRAFGDLADTWVTYITESFDPLMAKYPNVKVLSAMSGKWEPQTAAANVQQLLVANPNVDAIVVDSDWLASGIVANLEASGTYGKRGAANHIYFIGINGAPEAHQYIRDGWMDATLSTPVPDLTGAAVDVVKMLVNGEKLPAEYVQEGAAWSPAKIYPSPIYGDVHFPKEDKPYKGPILNMVNEMVTSENVDDAHFWGNMVGK